MSATYIHTKRKQGFSKLILRILAIIYFIFLGASIAYLWLFTKDRFTSSAEFRISKQDLAGNEMGLAQIALPGLADTGSVDSQVTIGYINSADLLLELESKFKLIDHYSAPKSDMVFRLIPDTKLEKRMEYYRKRITSHFDKETGMTVVSVDTFDPALSKEIAIYVLKRAEEFINTINQRIADQQLSFVRSEVDRSAKRVEDLNSELLTLQNENNFITPDEVIAANLSAVQTMKEDHLRTQAELSSLIRESPNSPRIESLRGKLRSLDELIQTESDKISGPEKDRLNQVLLKYKMLEHKMEFAVRLRTGAESMLEKNRVEAIARSRFLTVIQHPQLPEDVGFPRRPYATVTLLGLGFLLFVVLRALTRSVFDRV